MLYLLDANVLIDANRDFYSIDRVPEFWEWLAYQGSEGNVKIPIEVYEEIKEGKDDLARWTKEVEVKNALLLDEEAEPAIVSDIISKAYATDLSDDEVEKIGRDPFLIAYAYSSLGSRCVVTTEGSRPRRQRANRHIPDVCIELGIPWRNAYAFFRELDFRTLWKLK